MQDEEADACARFAEVGSEVLCLGSVQSDDRVILLRPDPEGELGARIA